MPDSDQADEVDVNLDGEIGLEAEDAQKSLQTKHGDKNTALRQMKSEDEAPTAVLCLKGIENLHLPFSETLEVNRNVLKKENISEEESTRWHNTTCSVVKEFEAHLPVLFNESDANNDGILDKEEIYNEFFLKIAGLQAPWRFVMVPKDVVNHFVFMDMNQDGLVSFYEYNLVHRVFGYLSYTFRDMEVEKFVLRYDTNQDSKVSVKEINSKEFYENFFQSKDVNHDNFLDLNETLNGAFSKLGGSNAVDCDFSNVKSVDERSRIHFETMDYNHDETISLSEYNKMHLLYVQMYNSLVYRDIDSYIDTIDVSHDGQISYMEVENNIRIVRNHCDIQMLNRFLSAMNRTYHPMNLASISKEKA